MKMKKLTASIIAGALMISMMGINAFADGAGTQPSIKVYGKAVPTSDATEFTVKLTDFAAVKGMKLEIASGAGLKLTGVSGDIVEAGNYKVTDNKITIVDVTNVTTANITVAAKVSTDIVDSAEITVKADLAQNGKSLYAEGTYDLVNGKVAVKTAKAAQKVVNAENLKEDSGYFIPFGSLGYTDSEGVFRAIPKSSTDGSFSKSDFPADLGSLSYNKYKLPANGIMTFGQGESKKVNGYQFGTYALENAGTKFGTMCIAGQWTEFVEYFKNNKNMTEGEMLSAIDDIYVAFFFRLISGKPAFNTFACSRDLINWNCWDGKALIESEYDWEESHAHKTWFVRIGGRNYHFYCAVDDEKNERFIALAVSD